MPIAQMTAGTGTAAATDAVPTDHGAETEGACPACPHPQDAHDAIGTRFCAATIARGLARGCACRMS